jgi:ferrous iron transport protein B
MKKIKEIKISLVGNPNTGKTSLFNVLTGLNQKVGNYPGITVDKKQGLCKLSETVNGIVTDLPGTYSINPTSIDESIVLDTLLNVQNEDYPDVVVVVAEVENLKRNLLLFTQIKDLEIPTILAINMSDQMKRKGISLDLEVLEHELKTKIVLISARKNIGIENLKEAIVNYKSYDKTPVAAIAHRMDHDFFEDVKSEFPAKYSLYKIWLLITQHQSANFISDEEHEKIHHFRRDINKIEKLQHRETILRYSVINEILKKGYQINRKEGTDLRAILDRILTHKYFGYFLFVFILLAIFQSVFNLATYPMDFIDSSFAQISHYLQVNLPVGPFSNLISEGIIPGIGGIVIFIPQIAILFFFIAVLEETGYMSRVVFLMDKLMRRFGLSGKSVIPLISGTACAVPAIMATRNINNWRERLITILVTPFTTCSARLPVYAIIIAVIIPNTMIYGVFNLQGLVMMALYIIGFATAIIAAYILHKTIKIEQHSFFVIEMPNYKLPSLKNVFYTVIEKTKAFVFDAGKIILSISIILWFLASNGPESYKNAEILVKAQQVENLNDDNFNQQLASFKLQNSYIGILGKTIEPAIAPLGYDWKIGIAIISSFAAREVFVSTLATIYSVESDEQFSTIKERLAAEKNPVTKERRFNFPTGLSLLIFYAFALQCASTIAIVKRETKSWKWPIIQFFGMGLMAYLAAFLTFNFFQ